MSFQNDLEHGGTVHSGTPLPLVIPPPTGWPFLFALGITMMAFGVVTSWLVSVPGFVLFVASSYGWFQDLRNDVLKELP